MITMDNHIQAQFLSWQRPGGRITKTNQNNREDTIGQPAHSLNFRWKIADRPYVNGTKTNRIRSSAYTLRAYHHILKSNPKMTITIHGRVRRIKQFCPTLITMKIQT